MKPVVTLFATIVVMFFICITLLVNVINPNDYREEIIRKVANKIGYTLSFNDKLRWHVWPSFSVLSGPITLKAPHAEEAILTADNIRFDVAFFPLFTADLNIKHVILDNAVIRLTDKSAFNAEKNAVANLLTLSPPVEKIKKTAEFKPKKRLLVKKSWYLDLKKIQFVDSLLIYQRSDQRELNLRNFNATLLSKSDDNIDMTISAQLTRNQESLAFKLHALADVVSFPDALMINVDQMNYQLYLNQLPKDGIVGQLAAKLIIDDKQWQISELDALFNGSHISGDLGAMRTEKPHYYLDLYSEKFDWNQLKGWHSKDKERTSSASSVLRNSVLVKSSVKESPLLDYLDWLNDFDATVRLRADELNYHDVTLNNVNFTGFNHLGVFNIDEATGEIAQGTVKIDGSFAAKNKRTPININLSAKQVDIDTLNSSFDFPDVMSGRLSFKGQLGGNDFDPDEILSHWKGHFNVAVQNATLNVVNMQQLIQQAVSQRDKSIETSDEYSTLTAFDSFTAQVDLNSGKLDFKQLNAESKALSMKGKGEFDLLKQQLDFALKVNVIEGWKGKIEKIDYLKELAIPLRLYGPWKQINYALYLDNVDKELLKDKGNKLWQRWLNKYQGNKSSEAVEQWINTL